MNRLTLDRNDSALIVIDVQEAFRTTIDEFSPMVAKICTAVRGAQMLGMPILVTEQYPKGLGPTVEEIALVLPDNTKRMEKTSFGVFGDDAILAAIEGLGRRQLVLCGLETHICVSQTSHQALEKGFDVLLLEDAVESRFETDRITGLQRLREAGVVVTSVEAMLFEVMQDSKDPRFKDIQALIK